MIYFRSWGKNVLGGERQEDISPMGIPSVDLKKINRRDALRMFCGFGHQEANPILARLNMAP
jgi:hypothetical protein